MWILSEREARNRTSTLAWLKRCSVAMLLQNERMSFWAGMGTEFVHDKGLLTRPQEKT